MNVFQVFPSINTEVQKIVRLVHVVGGEGFYDLMDKEAMELLVSQEEVIHRGYT